MGNFKLWNLILGWFSFIVALVVYGLTMEPTTSFWDCGEFISSAYGLQVGHPPGAPLFAMMGRMFALVAGSPANVAVMINFMSALASALTIAFLFWTVTALGQRILSAKNGGQPIAWDSFQMVSVLGSGLLGALAYTFSDTFWFSAVEGEVYATSSLFTAVVFWAMLRWDQVADKPHADRWIVLIAYLMGLSIGVHLLNLLTIPAIGFIYYFRKYKPTKKGIIITSLASIGALGFIQYGIIPGTIRLAAVFERLFVNSFNLGFGSGFFFYVGFVFVLLTAGIIFTMRKNYPKINLALWCVSVIIIGYSSYGMIVIRSLANTPMDENNPENVFSLISYLNREQYGDRPLLMGQYFDARITGNASAGDVIIKAYEVMDGKKVVARFTIPFDAHEYIKANEGSNLKIRHQYVKTDEKIKYKFDPNRQTFFPRMWSSEGRHVGQYRSWTGLKGSELPTFSHNLKFFFNYQINWMYFRYFMWNFAGRENDMQGNGEALNGHWISGFKFIDEHIAGVPQSDIPRVLAENKARNKLFFLPLILGLIGLFFHFKADRNGGVVVALLFFLTGLAIVIYLNQTPAQPRERDYAYAGSFYAYAIWIGLGIMGLVDYMRRLSLKDFTIPIVGGISGFVVTLIGFAIGDPGAGLALLVISFIYTAWIVLAHLLNRNGGKNPLGPAIVTAVAIIAVPVLMAFQNWDDHTRANRYTARDFAYNYLNSCAENGIMFTNGDNDTFPLWYLQEVEGVRRDVRIVNLSLLNTDWYVTQMKRKAYKEGLPVPFSLSEPLYRQGQRDAVLMMDNNKNYFTMQQHIAHISKTDGTNVDRNYDLKYFVSNKFIIPVDSANAVNNGFVPKGREAELLPEIRFEMKNPRKDRPHIVYLNTLMILDLLANFNWERPVYFSMTVGPEYYEFLGDYLQLEGLAYKLVPYKTPGDFASDDKINTDVSYEKLMSVFKWGNFNGKGIYLDETNERMVMQFKLLFVQLATKLFKEGQNAKSVEVLGRMEELMPDEVVAYGKMDINTLRLYYALKEYDKAEKTANTLRARAEEMTNYLAKAKKNNKNLDQDYLENEYMMRYCDEMLGKIDASRKGQIVPLDQPEPGVIQGIAPEDSNVEIID